ncbi:MAG: hypothetical protein U1E73_04590 [Planctomycetota bacterium]
MILALILFALGAGLSAMMTLASGRGGPEGPVGAHMVTAPLALLQAAGIGIAAACGLFAPWGVPAWAPWAALPGYVVAMTVLPILAWERRHRPLAFAGTALVGGGGGCMFLAGQVQPPPGAVVLIGAVPLLLAAIAGYTLLLALWLRAQRNAIRAIAADAERISDFQRNQAQYQRTEWAKLGPDAGLWQLIQFCHSFDADVQRECRERIAAMPDLPLAMQELLGTGWAEHALPCLCDAYPVPAADLAPALGAFYLRAAEKWESSLRGTEPGSWYANLSRYLEAAERVARDGGDMRGPMARWHTLLSGKRGLESLARRAKALAG